VQLCRWPGLGLALLLLVGAPASAREKSRAPAETSEAPAEESGYNRPGWYIAGGANFALLDAGSLRSPVEGGTVGFGPGANMRVGYRFSNRLGLEFEASWFQHEAVGRNDFIRLEGDLSTTQRFTTRKAKVPGDVLRGNTSRGKIFRIPKPSATATTNANVDFKSGTTTWADAECGAGNPAVPHKDNNNPTPRWNDPAGTGYTIVGNPNLIVLGSSTPGPGTQIFVDHYICTPFPTYFVDLSQQLIDTPENNFPRVAGTPFSGLPLMRDFTCKGCEELAVDTSKVVAGAPDGSDPAGGRQLQGLGGTSVFFDGDEINGNVDGKLVRTSGNAEPEDRFCDLNNIEPIFGIPTNRLRVDRDCKKFAEHPKLGKAFNPPDEKVEIRSDTIGLTVNLKGYPTYNGLPAILGPFSSSVSESTLEMLSLGGRLQPFAMIGAGVGLTRVHTTLIRRSNRDVNGFPDRANDIGADEFCNFVDKFGYVNPYNAPCLGLHTSPLGGSTEVRSFDELDANVLVKGGIGLDMYVTRNIAATVEARAIWLEGFGSVPLDLSVGLIYRFQ